MKESVEDDVADKLLRDAGESVAVDDEEEDDSADSDQDHPDSMDECVFLLDL